VSDRKNPYRRRHTSYRHQSNELEDVEFLVEVGIVVASLAYS
jgi:hypothetical protein